MKKKQKNKTTKVHQTRWTAHDRSYLQWCRVRWTIGTASGNQKRKTRRLKIEILSADKLWNERIPEQEPTEAIWYIKLWYFCIQCQSFFHLWRVTAGHKYLYFFFFLICYFFLSLGVNHFCLAPLWYCWTKKHVCEHIVIISVAFWMSIAL